MRNMMLGAIQPEYREVEWWLSDDLEQFVRDEVETSNEYRAAEALHFVSPEELREFSVQLAQKALHKSTTRETRRLVGLFLSEQQAEDRRTDFKVYLSGVYLEESPLVVTPHLTLREPQPEDAIEEVAAEADMPFSPPVADFHSIADFRSMHWGGVGQQEVLKTVNALSLFRVGGVIAPRYSMRTESFYPENAVISSPLTARSQYSFFVRKADVKQLCRSLAVCVPLMPDPLGMAEESRNEIAFARYRDALFSQPSVEKTIASAVMTLEALLLDGKEELKYRLSHRGAILLSALSKSTDPLAISSELRQAYDIRSAFAHGKVLKKNDRQNANQLAPKLLDYARQCILVFLQIKISKEDFLRQIDGALLSSVKVRELRRVIKTVIR